LIVGASERSNDLLRMYRLVLVFLLDVKNAAAILMEASMAKIPSAFSALLLAIATTAILAQPTPAAENAGPYRLDQTFHVGGKGNWDYLTVDPEGKLLYVPRTTHTMVLDANTGKTIADIPGQKGNHGVAVVPSAGRGFISDGKDGTVVIFDLKTNGVLGQIKGADDADAITYDPASHKVLVSCGDAGVMIPISSDVDPKSGNADAAVALEGKPEALIADGQGKAYINLVNKNVVAVVDTAAMKVIGKWPTSPGGAPVGMSIDREHRRLFVGCRNPQKLIVMSADDGKVLADLPIGAGCAATQFDDGYALASCRDGSLSVIREASPGKFEVAQTVKTLPGAKTMGVDPTTHMVFLPTAEFGKRTGARNRPIAKPDTFMILVVRRSGG
jgi:DNA-binding beta-propeller fold protein YncE